MAASVSRRSFFGLGAAALASLAFPHWTGAEEVAAQNGGIVIVHTNDVHCQIDLSEGKDGSLSNFGYAALAGYVAELRESYANVALVDAGDAVQGQKAGTLSNGEYLVDVMRACGYDVAIPGNHEFDYGMDQFNKLASALQQQDGGMDYVCCNFMRNGSSSPVLAPYTIKSYIVGTADDGSAITKKVAFVGVTTPATLSSCSPTSFKEGGSPTGEVVYNFCEDETGQKLYAVVQSAVDAAKAEGVDFVVLLGHLGQDGVPARWRSDAVAAHTSGIDVIIDGHSHEQYVQEAQNSEGKAVLITQTGTQLKAIGRVVIDPASCTVTVTSGSFSKTAQTANCADAQCVDADLVVASETDVATAKAWAASSDDVTVATAAAVTSVNAKVDEVAGQKVGTSLVKLWATEDDDWTWAVRTHETNCGDFVADAYWNFAYQAGSTTEQPTVAMVNGGGVRHNLEAGEVTKGDLIDINPFNNQLCYAAVTGQQILDALEMAVRKLPESSGSFPQVSGMTFKVNTAIDSTVEVDDAGNFVRVAGERRVYSVKVGSDALDASGTYTLVLHDYWLVSGGDGMSMLANSDVTFLGLDNQALLAYIEYLEDATISDYYADAAGTGRIKLTDGFEQEEEQKKEEEDADDEDGGASETENPAAVTAASGSTSGSETVLARDKQSIPAAGDDTASVLGLAAVGALAAAVGVAARE